MYRVGFPFWKLLARLGVPMLLRVEVLHDKEAGVFVARSPDLHGLVAEAASAEELFPAVYECADMLLEEALKQPPKAKTMAAWSGDFSPA